MILELFLGCFHKRYSFPFSTRDLKKKPDAALATGTYVVCLDCGKELSYDWEEMKVLSERKAAQLSAEQSLAAK